MVRLINLVNKLLFKNRGYYFVELWTNIGIIKNEDQKKKKKGKKKNKRYKARLWKIHEIDCISEIVIIDYRSESINETNVRMLQQTNLQIDF